MPAASHLRAPCRRIRLPDAWYAQHTRVVMWRRHLRGARPLLAWKAAGGPVQINVCIDHKDRCEVSANCSMYHVWKAGQDRMLEVYRRTTLAELAQSGQAQPALVAIGTGREGRDRPRA